MTHETMAISTALLTSAPDEGFAQWRRLFLDALERRQDRRCLQLLILLAQAPASWLRQAHRHYLAVLYSVQQRYDQAESLLRDLLAEALTPLQRVRSELELAILLDEQGEWDEADRYYAAAVNGYHTLGDALGEAKAHNNWAISLCYRAEQGWAAPPAEAPPLPRALDHHARARKLATDAGNAGAWELAKSWHGLGKVYGQLQAYTQAEEAFATYLRLSAEQENPHVRGYTLTDLAALVYLPQGKLDAATAALDEALSLLQAHDDPLNLAEAQLVRGQVLARQGALDAALIRYAAAIDATESIRSRLTAPSAQIRSRATTDTIYRAPLSVHLTRGDGAAAFTAAERARARVLADLLARQQARPQVALPKGLLAQRDRLCRTLDQAYAALDAGSEPGLAAAITTHEQKLAEVDRRVEGLDKRYASLATLTPLDTAAVQARLADDAALLTWVADDKDRIWMLVVTPHEVQLAPAPPTLKLRWLQGQLADALDGTRQGSLTPDPLTGALAPLRLYAELHRALIAPVEPLLASARTLYLVPAGPLHHVPMGALTREVDGPAWGAGRRVVYAPSATVLLDYCQQRPPSPHRRLLAVAPSDPHLRYLQSAATGMARRTRGAAMIGDGATCQALLRRARHYRILCFLGHAWFDRRYPMSSRLQLADGSLHASEILRSLRLQTDLTILAACETGRGQVPRGDEILGLSRALLYAGTPSLLVTLWRVHEVPTRLLVEKLIAALSLGDGNGTPRDAAAALAHAQQWLQRLTLAEAQVHIATWEGVTPTEIERQLRQLWQMSHPGAEPHAGAQLFAHPFFWSPYVLIGDRTAAPA